MYFVTRDELRLCVLAYLSTRIYPSKLQKVASLETKFRSLSSLGRIALYLKCQSRDRADSEWIQRCCTTVAILDKFPLQGGKFCRGVEKGNVASPCSPAATSRTVSPRSPATGSPTVLPTASREEQDGGSVQGEGGIGRPIVIPALRDDALAQRRAVLDRCHEQLVARGFGVLELWLPLTWRIARASGTRWLASWASTTTTASATPSTCG